MIKIDWSRAPKDATHILIVEGKPTMWYKVTTDDQVLYRLGGDWNYSNMHTAEFIRGGGDEARPFIPRIKSRIQYKGMLAPVPVGCPLVDRFISET